MTKREAAQALERHTLVRTGRMGRDDYIDAAYILRIDGSFAEIEPLNGVVTTAKIRNLRPWGT